MSTPSGGLSRGRRSRSAWSRPHPSNDPRPERFPGNVQRTSQSRAQVCQSRSLAAAYRQHGDVVVVTGRSDPANPSGDPFEEGMQVVAVLGDRVADHGGEAVDAGVEVLVAALDETVRVEQDDAAARQVDRLGAAIDVPDPEGRPDGALPAGRGAVRPTSSGGGCPATSTSALSVPPPKASRTNVTSGCSLDRSSIRSSPAATAAGPGPPPPGPGPPPAGARRSRPRPRRDP